jgi:hypothetical protein
MNREYPVTLNIEEEIRIPTVIADHKRDNYIEIQTKKSEIETMMTRNVVIDINTLTRNTETRTNIETGIERNVREEREIEKKVTAKDMIETRNKKIDMTSIIVVIHQTSLLIPVMMNMTETRELDIVREVKRFNFRGLSFSFICLYSDEFLLFAWRVLQKVVRRLWMS